METLSDLDIVRTWHLQVRADEESASDGTLGTMEIRFSMFNTWYEIDSWWEGRFLEQTAKGAFKKTISDHNGRKNESAGAKVLFNHGHDFHIGDKLLGGIRSLTEEKTSPLGIVDLDDTSYNRDLLPGLKRGGYGSSFMFRVIRDEWNDEPGKSEHNPEGIPERTIKEVRLFEFGPVTWPANPESTAGMRCVGGTDSYYAAERSRNPGRVDILRSRVERLRTPEPGAAPVLPAMPVIDHLSGVAQAHQRSRYLYLQGVS